MNVNLRENLYANKMMKLGDRTAIIGMVIISVMITIILQTMIRIQGMGDSYHDIVYLFNWIWIVGMTAGSVFITVGIRIYLFGRNDKMKGYQKIDERKE